MSSNLPPLLMFNELGGILATVLGDEAFGVFAASLRVEDVSTYMHG